MKKLLAVILLAAALLSLTACGSTQTTLTKEALSAAILDTLSAPETAPDPAPAAEEPEADAVATPFTAAITAVGKRTALSELDTFNSDGWNMGYSGGVPEDVFGNQYSTESPYTFLIYENFDRWYWYNCYGEYRLSDYDYTTITMTIAPYSSMTEGGSARVELYAEKTGVYDEQLIFTFDVDKKTEPYEMKLDTLGDIDYLKIMVSAFQGGVILSDIYLQ